MLPILATCCRQKLPSSRDLVLVGLAGGWAEVSSPRRGLDRGLLGEADGVLRKLSRRGHAGGTGGTGGFRAEGGAGGVAARPCPRPPSPSRGFGLATGQYAEDKPGQGRTMAALTAGPARCPARRMHGVPTWLSGAAWGAVCPSGWGLRVSWWEAAGAEGAGSQSSVGGIHAAHGVCDLRTSGLNVPLWRTGLEAPCSRPHRRGRLWPGPGRALAHGGHREAPVCSLCLLLVPAPFLGSWSSSAALGTSDPPGPCPRPPLPSTWSLGDRSPFCTLHGTLVLGKGWPVLSDHR